MPAATDYQQQRPGHIAAEVERWQTLSRYESSILGAILLDENSYEQAAELRADDFLLDANRRIFVCISDLAATKQPIDILTVTEELDSRNELQSVGEVGYISALLDGVPDRPN